MNTCQFQTQANGPKCGLATLGTYCWFHENLITTPQATAQQAPTNTVGTSHAWATTNTTPEMAVQQTLAMRATASKKAPWYRGMRWWKVLIALMVLTGLGLLVWKYWLIVGGIVLGLVFLTILLMLSRFFGGMNLNMNDNTNENVNQNTLNPTFNVSPIINVQVDRD